MKHTYKIVHWKEDVEPREEHETVEKTKQAARDTAYWFAVYQQRAAEVYEQITNEQGETIEERILAYFHNEHGLQVDYSTGE